MHYLKYALIIWGFAFVSNACSNNSNEQNNADPKMSIDNHKAHANMNMSSAEPSGESIYNVQSTWENQHGNSVKLDSLRGKIQVITMVYTSCEYACPRILADMKRIRDGLPERALRNTNFTIVSIDPERDTRERLDQFAKDNNLTDRQWTLLKGDDGEILELAALLGFKYKRISETDFTHSNLITLLNREGEIIYQRKNLAEKPNKIIAKIERQITD